MHRRNHGGMYFHYRLETNATPEQVFRAFTDVSDRRLDVWRKTLDPKKYELREHGDTWAVVKEGSAGTKIWVLLRYEWQEPGTIHWSVLDSDHATVAPATSPSSRASGRQHGERRLRPSGPTWPEGRAILLMQRLLGPIAFPRLWKGSHPAGQFRS